ncbi:hypothetical protein BHE74_00010288 [Ensete ventricosum]|nr:hypothetical protein BHE74_00010288 [Ensete ventricosum]
MARGGAAEVRSNVAPVAIAAAKTAKRSHAAAKIAVAEKGRERLSLWFEGQQRARKEREKGRTPSPSRLLCAPCVASFLASFVVVVVVFARLNEERTSKEMPIGAADDGGRPPASTAVAIDKDKNSQQAVKWAIDHLLLGSYAVILIHVKTKPPMNRRYPSLFGCSCVRTCTRTPSSSSSSSSSSCAHLLLILYLRRRGWSVTAEAYHTNLQVHMTEVVLEDNDVSKAIIDYINANYIQNIVVGASSRNALTKYRHFFVASAIYESLLLFSNRRRRRRNLWFGFAGIYVISKGKPVTVRTAKGPPPLASQPSVLADPDDSIKTPFTRAGYRGTMAPGTPDRRSFEKNMDHIRTPSRERQLLAGRTPPGNVLLDGIDSSHRPPRPSTSRDMIFDDLDFQAGTGFQSMDFGSMEISSTSSDSPKGSLSPNSGVGAPIVVLAHIFKTPVPW